MKGLLTGLLLVFVVWGGVGCARAEDSALTGKTFKDFTLERMSGTKATLSQLVKGKKAFVFFFATWCPHCSEQLQALSAHKAEIAAQGIVVNLVDIGEPKEKVARFLKARGIENDVFLDQDSSVAENYAVVGVPMVFFIGADGIVRGVEYGLPENYQELLK
ncbi:MAG: TlpA disulfide reductase family protein [Candidatus Omnitrophota bacterium]